MGAAVKCNLNVVDLKSSRQERLELLTDVQWQIHINDRVALITVEMSMLS